MTTLTITECPVCHRDFALEGKPAGDCLEHCGPSCCRQAICSMGRKVKHNPFAKWRTCIVCQRSNRRFPFEAFAPCDEGCDRIYSHSPSNYQNGYSRGWHCLGVWSAPDEWTAKHHKPNGKPRVHIKYCSLKCYYHSTLGHDARKNAGVQRRARRYWTKNGGEKNATLAGLRERGAIPPRPAPIRSVEEWRERYPLRPGRPAAEQPEA